MAEASSAPSWLTDLEIGDLPLGWLGIAAVLILVALAVFEIVPWWFACLMLLADVLGTLDTVAPVVHGILDLYDWAAAQLDEVSRQLG